MYKDLLIGLGIILTSFTFIKNEPITLYIIGDSTAANKAKDKFPETGWGMELQSFFNEEVKVDNRALNGRSTKSFINEKRWENILTTLKEGDFVLIEFGHNDEKIENPKVGTSLGEFKVNLIKYVQETQAKKAHPILLTPIVRRNFINGVLTDTHKGYPDVVRKLADSLRIPLIDMQRKTEKLVKSLGDESSKKLFLHLDSGHVNYPKGLKDNTHLNVEGAKAFAGLVAAGVKETKTSLAKHLLKK
ncbi:rhamnogalacturonan acetylesterase [Pedobacter frigiditerrae]|uniref:Rhamnogalacturonan acetylesterase n=1 Tax=Pedobacter frigiditerrae TaxID=2530452 RepID=A0A4R0MX47_9SPHI|nr:rhamnogalacturonan acetylesterase [Pedobacter frigiditerrae]TCC91849.1 rhamnogalacturonan acetylesterase [Pedobacter frigiditerrae]